MIDNHEDFQALLQQLCEGSPEAARKIHDRYGEHLRRVVRRRMHERLRSLFDSIDFLQSVWASFFAGSTDPRRFDSPEALLRYLSKMAQNKVIEVSRSRLGGKRRNLFRERSLEQTAETMPATLRSLQPTPSQTAMAEEEWQRLLAGQPILYQRILELRRKGYTHHEIASLLEISTKQVQRVLRRLSLPSSLS